MPLAAQLYTLREFTRSAPEIARTIKRVKNIGYDAVQVSALGPIEPPELKRILEGEGVTCCATHVAFDRMRDDTQAVIDEHHLLNCRYTAIGSMPPDFRNEGGYRAFAKQMSDVAVKLAAGGLTLGYHNHSFELERFGKKTALDILIEESDPAVTFEIDTYWIAHGGGDPAAWISKLAGRIPLIHLKDMTFGEDATAARTLKRNEGESDEHFVARQEVVKAKKPIMAEVGEGNLNWPAILEACRAAGVAWNIIEQDTCQRDPFESLAISLTNARALGFA